MGSVGAVHIWETASGKPICSLPFKDHKVNSLQFTADGKGLLTTCCPDSATTDVDKKTYSVRLWAVDSKRQLRVWQPPLRKPAGEPAEPIDESCYGAMVSADGKQIVWGITGADCGIPVLNSPMHALRVVDTETGKELYELKGLPKLKPPDADRHSGPLLSFSGNGKHLAIATGEGIRILDASSGRQQRFIRDKHWPDSLAFTPDGKSLACVRGSDLQLYEPAAGKSRLKLELPFPVEILWHFVQLRMAFFPGGSKVAVAGENKILVFDLVTGKELVLSNGHRWGVQALRFGADGRTLASTSSDRYCFWKTADWKQIEAYPSRETNADSSAFRHLSLLSKRYVCQPWDRKEFKVRDLKTGQVVRTIKVPDGSFGVGGISPDGKTLALVHEPEKAERVEVRFYDADLGKERSTATAQGVFGSLAFSQDSTLALWVDRVRAAVQIVDVATGKTVRLVPLPKKDAVSLD